MLDGTKKLPPIVVTLVEALDVMLLAIYFINKQPEADGYLGGILHITEIILYFFVYLFANILASRATSDRRLFWYMFMMYAGACVLAVLGISIFRAIGL